MPDIELLGATYQDVPAVDLPKSGGGNARFYDPGEIEYASSPTSGGNADIANAILYANVDATSTSTAFTATITGLTELVDGTAVMLHNGVVTSASGFTVDINSLGAKKCYNNMTNATQDTTIFNVNYTMLFVYASDLDSGNGGFWIYRGYNSDNNTIGYQLRTNSGTLPMKTYTRRYRLLLTSADGTGFVSANSTATNTAAANKTTNTDKIDPFGAIYYYGTTTNLNAGTAPAATSLWQQYAINLQYSFYPLTLTANLPTYLKCTPQSDGSAVMDSVTQTLPSTNDGKIYIFLGIAYSASNIELNVEHPVYYHDGTALRLWTGASAGGSVSPSSTTPKMDGTAAVGSETAYARGDHIHPTDTSRAPMPVGNGYLYYDGISIAGDVITYSDVGAAAASHTHAASDITSGLATVATSGSYSDLSGTPTIPAAGIPSGGTSGQVLAKSSGTDYDVGWVNQSGGGAQTTFYGTCDTSDGTAAKVVTCSGFALAAGNIIGILFSVGNTAASPTLNVNGTGAKSIYVGNIPPTTGNVLKWSAGTMLYFMYDGTYFRYICSVAAGNVIQPDGGGTWYASSSAGEATAAAKTAAITNFRLTPGAVVHIKTGYANTYTSGAITLNVSGTGTYTIYVNNAATSASNTLTWTAGELLTFVYDGSYWRFVCRDKESGGGGGSLSWTNISDHFYATVDDTTFSEIGSECQAWTDGHQVWVSICDEGGDYFGSGGGFYCDSAYLPAIPSKTLFVSADLGSDYIFQRIIWDEPNNNFWCDSDSTGSLIATFTYPI